jgi:predicted nuclease of predicted toxin-antitoxin system
VRFKIDENLPQAAADLLRSHEHDVETVHDEHLRGAPDATLYARCQHEARILVTLDRDFADIRAYPPRDTPGLIVLRPANQSKEPVLRLLARTIPVLSTEPIAQRLWIVEESRVRIRE